MSKQKWSRKDAVEYLAASGFQFKRGHKYTDKYLKRTAASYKKQEQQGLKPSLTRARGHAKPQHIPRAGRVREQYRIGSAERKATKKDIARLREAAAKGTRLKKNETPEQYTQRTGKTYKTAIGTHEVTTDAGVKEQYYTGNITGVLAVGYSTHNAGDEATLSFHISAEHLAAIEAQYNNPVDIANALMASSGVQVLFSDVYSFNIT